MAKELTPVDITDAPDLLRIAEEVRRSGKPRLLRRDDEDLAVLFPAPKSATRRARKARSYTQADDEAFLSSAGGWQGNVDSDTFLQANEQSRRLSVSKRAPNL